MRPGKLRFKKVLSASIAAGVLLACAGSAQASLISGVTYRPLITAGVLPDSPAARVDENSAASPFSGVVSLQIVSGGITRICSGALVGKRQVISAGHCVDSNGNGSLIDLSLPGNAVTVVFNSNGTFNAFGAVAHV